MIRSYARFSLSLALLLFFGAALGCGYNLRGGTRPFFESHQIKTLYVEPVKNNSYKPGVEIIVYNSLRRRIAQGGYVRIVDDPNGADTSFLAIVNEASYSPVALTTADQLAPLHTGNPNTIVASSYAVSLRVKFFLSDHRVKDHPNLWVQEISRAKNFQASTFIGTLGDTSALVNESEFERTIAELSTIIVTDAEESINALSF